MHKRDNFSNLTVSCPRARSAAEREPGVRVTNSEILMSCVGLVWTIDLFADVIKFRPWTGD